MTKQDDKNFYAYFKKNMEAMGFKAPISLFDTQDTAVKTAASIVAPLHLLGKDATIGEILGATTLVEELAVLLGIGASYYVGVVIGSLAVAAGKSMSGGYSISDVLNFARKHNLSHQKLSKTLVKFPGIINTKHPGREFYCKRMILKK